jgi:hypothetical protein
MKDIHNTDIIEGKLSVSYEEGAEGMYDDGIDTEGFPEAAVLLITRCCEINHEHISLTKDQAMVLASWLVNFANGEYDE